MRWKTAPVHPEPEPQEEREAPRQDAAAPAFTGMRVLLVGESGAERLARVLARDGHDVLSADAPEAAIRLGGVFDPDVIVFVGESCRELRRAVPSAGIIALVAGQDVAERVNALQAGADDCLASPWNEAELRARVRAMARRRARVWRCAAAGSSV
jgi:DNA-binding response OmpR family regulator